MKTIITTLFLFFVTTTFSQDSVVHYYNEIAGKSEYGDSSHNFVKWKNDVKIFFDFEDNDSIKEYTKIIINELNNLIDPITISIAKDKKEANTFIYFCDFSEYKKRANITINGKFLGFVGTVVYQSRIYTSHIFINERLCGIELKSVLREEITQSLGLMNDSWKYPESVFYQGGCNTNKFSEIDKAIIKLHYNK